MVFPMRARYIAIALSLVLVSLQGPPALAATFTGAEFKQANDNYAMGYLHGVLEAYFGVLLQTEDYKALAYRRKQCFLSSKIDLVTFLAAVRNYIDRNPAALTEQAIGPTIRTLIEICD
jgi:hypothetical protein